MKKLPLWLIGEFLGTFLLVFFGCGSVCAAVTTGAQVGVFQVAIIWGLGIATAIYLTGSLSGAHLNPAVTLTVAAFGDFPKSRVLPYIATQLVAAFVAAAVLYLVFGDALRVYEAKNGIIRGTPGSEASAMVFGEYYPNPGGSPLTPAKRLLVSNVSAVAAEIIGTAVLLVVILACTDTRNQGRPHLLTALTIGLTVTMLISLFGPLTMACFNPARDFGPRVFSALAGWGTVPFTANDWGWLNVYILSPIFGGLLGGRIYTAFLKPAYARSES